ncbi:hypothetical protein PINS_up007474 [Pythium insidiosum]|nr:hypothetical protein PINS_up007474 [Pythium insidiosum]
MAETEDVKLGCAVYGERAVFPVKIKRNATVNALQEAIFTKQRYAPSALTLYLARKEGETTWLTGADRVDALLRGKVDKQYMAMWPLWRLNKEELFGPNITPGEDEIHVLVELTNKRLCAEKMLDINDEDVPQIKLNGAHYVTLPAAFLERCGFKAEDAVMLYCRPQMRDLWTFVQDEVITKNGIGCVVGPPGTGKSMATLSFVASLDQEEWNVVWVHLSSLMDSCFAMGSKKYWEIDALKQFELPRVTGKKLLICVDGYKATPEHQKFFKHIYRKLDKTHDRLLVCSSMATLGKRNLEDDRKANLRVFFMYSWTQDEYIAATADPVFYDKIKSKLDTTSSNEVNGDVGLNASESVEDKKEYALGLKYYYAGGSCRFVFQYPTRDVVTILEDGVESVENKSELVKCCGGQYHTDAINRLYGMHGDGSRNVRFPVSSYADFLFAQACDEVPSRSWRHA